MSTSIELPSYAQGVLGSSALLDLSATAVKNIPYAFLATELHINDLSNLLTSKISYGETLLRSIASAVYNFAIATAFTALAIPTFGQSSSINNATKKFWIYTTLSIASVGIAMVGLISARAAIVATGLILTSSTAFVIQSTQSSIVKTAKHYFKYYKPQLIEALPAINIHKLEAKIMKASTIKELVSATMDTINKNSP